MFGVTPARPIAVTETCWTINELINKGDILKLGITIKRGRKIHYITKLSKEYIINDDVSFQLRMDCSLSMNNFTFDSTSKKENVLIFCKFDKAKRESDALYCAYVTCSDNYVCKTFFVNDSWRVLFDNNLISEFTINIFVGNLNQILKPFAPLYSDSESADLQLTATDGHIKLHSVVLVACSPILKRELCEKREPCQPYELVIPNVKQSTLQLLKDYLYMKNVPDSPLSSIMDLLQFASRYKIVELCQLCTQNLIYHANANNFYQLTEFAHSNQLKELYLNMLELVANCTIESKDIKKHVRPDAVSNYEEIETK